MPDRPFMSSRARAKLGSYGKAHSLTPVLTLRRMGLLSIPSVATDSS